MSLSRERYTGRRLVSLPESRRRVVWPRGAWCTAAGALAWPFLAQCGPRDSVTAAAVPRCPDLTVDALDRYDFATEMTLPTEVSSKLKAGIEAALLVNKLAEEVDMSVKQTCLAYLTDLGAVGGLAAQSRATTSGSDCGNLVEALGDLRTKLGAAVEITVDAEPSRCGAPVDIVSACATKCDPLSTPASAKAVCEAGTLQGTCDTQCLGSCDAVSSNASPVTCDGTCDGTCDARMKGTCSGLCVGRCDGKPTKKGGAVCAAVCDGTCDGGVEAICLGGCVGNCKLVSPASCAGVCTGGCTSELKSARCMGDVTAPKMNDDCKAKCDAEFDGSVSCEPGRVFVRIEGATDAAAAEAFKRSAEKELPAILKIAAGMAPRLPRLLAEVQDAVSDVQTTVKSAVINPVAAAQVAGCFAKPFADVAAARASLQGNVDLAVGVKASVASGGAGAPAAPVGASPRGSTPVPGPLSVPSPPLVTKH